MYRYWFIAISGESWPFQSWLCVFQNRENQVTIRESGWFISFWISTDWEVLYNSLRHTNMALENPQLWCTYHLDESTSLRGSSFAILTHSLFTWEILRAFQTTPAGNRAFTAANSCKESLRAYSSASAWHRPIVKLAFTSRPSSDRAFFRDTSPTRSEIRWVIISHIITHLGFP